VYTKGGLDFIHLGMVRDGLRYLWKAFRMNPLRCVVNIVILLVRYLRKKTCKPDAEKPRS
jgi:hypothetical protein